MRHVRTPSWSLASVEQKLRHLHEVIADIAHAINTEEDIRGFAVTALDGPGEAGTGAGGGDHTHVFHDTPSGSGVGPYTLAASPVAGTETVYVSGIRQRRKASAPGLNEYYMSAVNQITFGYDVSGLYICADYKLATAVTHTHVFHEAITETGVTVHLGATPTAGSETLFFNLLRLRRLPSGSPGLNEYTISGNAVTLAAPGRTSGDYMTADYLT